VSTNDFLPETGESGQKTTKFALLFFTEKCHDTKCMDFNGATKSVPIIKIPKFTNICISQQCILGNWTVQILFLSKARVLQSTFIFS